MNYFKDEEFKCPCCGKFVISSSLKFKLNHARHIANIPFIITSGYRCLAHNEAIGKSPTSSHLKGHAVDVSVKSSRDRYKILEGAIHAGFNRIGIGKDFIHLDDDLDKDPKVCWDYYEEKA
ncbi:MAG: peptidase M15 [Aliifodinibius sp.]|nr:peptidase M15 [Fodinibius sp.]